MASWLAQHFRFYFHTLKSRLPLRGATLGILKVSSRSRFTTTNYREQLLIPDCEHRFCSSPILWVCWTSILRKHHETTHRAMFLILLFPHRCMGPRWCRRWPKMEKLLLKTGYPSTSTRESYNAESSSYWTHPLNLNAAFVNALLDLLVTLCVWTLLDD